MYLTSKACFYVHTMKYKEYHKKWRSNAGRGRESVKGIVDRNTYVELGSERSKNGILHHSVCSITAGNVCLWTNLLAGRSVLLLNPSLALALIWQPSI